MFAEIIFNPDLSKIFFPNSTLVPANLTTKGIESFISLTASTIPWAKISHLIIPPKILTKIPLTFLSDKIILSDKNVKGILINILGGIMRCDVLAQGVVEAAKETHLSVPLVVRLAGTNVELGKEILKKSNLKIISANNLADAAKKIVEITK